jgi:hypothetical protein
MLQLARTTQRACLQRHFFSLNDISKLAGLAPGLKESAGVESDGDGQRFHARKILPYVRTSFVLTTGIRSPSFTH